MAKKPQAAPSKDARAERKKLRTQANKAVRAKAHAKRVAKPTCWTKGTARALRRWCEGVSREFPEVLKRSRHSPASLVRSKSKSRPKRQPRLMLSINGKVMGSMAEVMFTVREMAEKRRQEAATSLV